MGQLLHFWLSTFVTLLTICYILGFIALFIIGFQGVVTYKKHFFIIRSYFSVDWSGLTSGISDFFQLVRCVFWLTETVQFQSCSCTNHITLQNTSEVLHESTYIVTFKINRCVVRDGEALSVLHIISSQWCRLTLHLRRTSFQTSVQL